MFTEEKGPGWYSTGTGGLGGASSTGRGGAWSAGTEGAWSFVGSGGGVGAGVGEGEEDGAVTEEGAEEVVGGFGLVCTVFCWKLYSMAEPNLMRSPTLEESAGGTVGWKRFYLER